jgi:hypothetical protein
MRGAEDSPMSVWRFVDGLAVAQLAVDEFQSPNQHAASRPSA